MRTAAIAPDLLHHFNAYEKGGWRPGVFRDIVLAELRSFEKPIALDIGCGSGFDGYPELQQSLAGASARYIGVDPDPGANPPSVNELHNCVLEEAPLQSASVHVAFSTYVQEHVEDPARFWAKLSSVLVPGGVYWGFTVDARHWFRLASSLLGRLRLKDLYLRFLWRDPREEPYTNFPTRYRLNTPRDIRRQAAPLFSSLECWSLSRVGQVKHYLPPRLRGVSRLIDRVTMGLRLPGVALVVRAVK